MTTSESQPTTEHRYDVPQSAWVMGWLFLGDQVARLIVEGPGEDNVFIVSTVVGALLVGLFAYGVLTARPIRVAIVWILLVLAAIAEVIRLFDDPTIWHAARVFISGAQLWAFLVLRQTAFYAWQKTRPRDAGEGLGALVLMAIAVGAIGGIIGASNDGFNIRVNF